MGKIDLAPFIQTVEKERLRLEGIIINQNGEEVARHHFIPERRRVQFSISKSFLSTAIGFAVAEGLLSLDDLVSDHLHEDITIEYDAFQTLNIRHLLTMSMGQDREYMMEEARKQVLRKKEEDWVQYALRKPFVDKPGERFLYTNAGPYLAGIILQRIVGTDLVEYLMPRLFEPLAIPRPVWEADPQGLTFGSSGLQLTVSEVERFARLYLQHGKWEGKQILPEGWATEATRTHIMNDQEPADNHLGYGYLFWRSQHGAYRCDGYRAKFGIVLEDKSAVIAINSDEDRQQRVLDVVWETIYPQL